VRAVRAVCRDGVVTALLCLALAGCRHQDPVPALPAPARTPDIYVPPPPSPSLPPMQAPPPKSVTEVKPTVTPEIKPKKRKKVTPPAPTVAIAQPPKPIAETLDTTAVAPGAAVAPATPPPSSALGDLSPGGGSSPQQQQQVADRITAIERRLNDLPARTNDDQKKQISQVRLFLKQASDALKTGDSEGAANLATKAGLLLDDILK
jgi:hypothetical protein